MVEYLYRMHMHHEHQGVHVSILVHWEAGITYGTTIKQKADHFVVSSLEGGEGLPSRFAVRMGGFFCACPSRLLCIVPATLGCFVKPLDSTYCELRGGWCRRM
jgi:hypothetical protein